MTGFNKCGCVYQMVLKTGRKLVDFLQNTASVAAYLVSFTGGLNKFHKTTISFHLWLIFDPL